jgi:aminomethyltransferase
MVEFAGYMMPIRYSTINEEHNLVRNVAGLFDVSHMGRFWISGEQAEDFLNYLLTNNAQTMEPGRARYSLMCNEKGGVVDDLIMYKFSEERFLLVVNAANLEKDSAWITKYMKMLKPGCLLQDASDMTAMIALQGPRSEEILQQLTSSELAELPYYHFLEASVAGKECIIARTGYTGEDGFELIVAREQAVPLWRELIRSGAQFGLRPIGLAARDTLRLECAMMLYGNDITEYTTPLEAGLERFIDFNKRSFVGKQALEQQLREGITKKLVGFRMVEQAIPRHGYLIFDGNTQIGHVTSGTFSPTLKQPIGLGYVSIEHAEEGTELHISIRSRIAKARIVKLPFYRRER